jgi:hypothetical protein
MRIQAALVSVVVAGFLAAPANAAPAADLAAGSVVAPTSLTVLGAATVTVKVRNVGRAVSAPSLVTVVLSSDARRDKADHVIGTALSRKRLKRGGTERVRVAAVPHDGLGTRSYVLLACVAPAKGRQASTRNDCAAAKRRVRLGGAVAAIHPQISADATAAASKTLDAAGGSVDVALPGGSHATLTVPDKALGMPTAIALIPVTSVAPGPRGVRPASSVLVSPEGLVAPGSTLTFTAPSGTPASRLRAFAFGGEDEAIVAAPFLARPALSVDASVFGGYGVGTPSAAAPATARSAACPRAAAAAVDPCKEESLRKRLNEILAGTNAADPSALAAADAFVKDVVYPEIDAQVAAGATAEEISDLVSIPVALARQEQLMGIPPPADNVLSAKLEAYVKRTAENSLKRCEDRKQGPITTKLQLLQISRQAQLMGSPVGDLVAEWVARCASKPWYLAYDMTVHETPISSPSPPDFEAGNGHVGSLAVPVPGSGTDSGQGPLAYSGLSCSPGSSGAFSGCSITSAAGDLQVSPTRSEVSSTVTTRCGRTVKVPVVMVFFKFVMASEAQTLHFCVTNGPCVDGGTGGGFQRGIDVVTEGNRGELSMPDAGGRVELSGADPSFGGFLAVNGKGSAELKLTQ